MYLYLNKVQDCTENNCNKFPTIVVMIPKHVKSIPNLSKIERLY